MFIFICLVNKVLKKSFLSSYSTRTWYVYRYIKKMTIACLSSQVTLLPNLGNYCIWEFLKNLVCQYRHVSHFRNGWHIYSYIGSSRPTMPWESNWQHWMMRTTKCKTCGIQIQYILWVGKKILLHRSSRTWIDSSQVWNGWLIVIISGVDGTGASLSSRQKNFPYV